MALATRRQFLQQAAFASAALCGRPTNALAGTGWIFEPLEQVSAPLDATAVQQLATQIKGQVITPNTPDYGSARLVFNRAFDRHPALIAQCAGASDVARALEFAQKQNLPLAVRGNPDLFWAIRGGGGNFGVVTALEFRLHPVTDVLGGTLTYEDVNIAELLQAFAKFVAVAPDEMNVVGVVSPSKQGTQFRMLVCHCGQPRQGNELLKPMRALKPQEDKVRVQSYLEMQTTINPAAPVAHFQTDLFLPNSVRRQLR